MSNINYFIDFCKYSQILHYLSKHYVKTHISAKAGEFGENAAVSTGPEKKHPIEATTKNKLERQLDTDLPDVTLHYGGGNNQHLLTIFAALALTDGKNIFIREESYKEGSQETEKILLHEMLHVLQYKNYLKINSIDDKNNAEAEVLHAEKELYPDDMFAEPYEIFEINGKKIRLTQRQKKKFISDTVDTIEKWVKEQKTFLSEEEYLKFLCKLQDYKDHPSLSFFSRKPKNSQDALLLEIEKEFRGRLY